MGELLVGEYLLKRVKELGVESVFGVPGGNNFVIYRGTDY